VTFSITMLYQSAECCILFMIMLNVIMMSAVMLKAVILSVIMLSVVAPFYVTIAGGQ
jgi:hypothetical protein